MASNDPRSAAAGSERILLDSAQIKNGNDSLDNMRQSTTTFHRADKKFRCHELSDRKMRKQHTFGCHSCRSGCYTAGMEGFRYPSADNPDDTHKQFISGRM